MVNNPNSHQKMEIHNFLYTTIEQLLNNSYIYELNRTEKTLFLTMIEFFLGLFVELFFIENMFSTYFNSKPWKIFPKNNLKSKQIAQSAETKILGFFYLAFCMSLENYKNPSFKVFIYTIYIPVYNGICNKKSIKLKIMS